MNTIKEQYYLQAKQWMMEAGAIIREQMDQPLFIETKSNRNDLVTVMDKKIEQFFAERIEQTYPNHRMLGEEGFGNHVTDLQGTLWIIDPIDGTMNFVHQQKNFAISLAVYEEGIGLIGCIYDVMADDFYHGIHGEGAYKNGVRLPLLNEHLTLEGTMLACNHFWLCTNKLVSYASMEKLVRSVRGVRTYGSAALEFAFVADGTLDAYMSMRLAPWDIAAGMILVREVGGVTTNVYGEEINLLDNGPILTSNAAVHEEMIKYTTDEK